MPMALGKRKSGGMWNGHYVPARNVDRFNRSLKRMRTQFVRKSFRNYPIYQNVFTAPAPKTVELKYDGGIVETFAIDSTPEVILLSTIATGSGSSERIGKRIKFHDIEFKWAFLTNAVHNYNHVNFMIVYDKSPNGALPAYTDILTSSAVTSLPNADTRSRFQTLFEQRFCDSKQEAATFSAVWAGPGISGHKIISLKGKHAHYIGTGAAITDIEQGAIYLVVNSYSDDVTAMEFTNRIQYSDA